MEIEPAWLSAGAAIVALFISTMSVVRPTLADRRERRIRARALAVAIYPDVRRVSSSLKDATAVFEGCISRKSGAKLGQAEVPLPVMLDRMVTDLWRLGGK